jgi:hypothetical protein
MESWSRMWLVLGAGGGGADGGGPRAHACCGPEHAPPTPAAGRVGASSGTEAASALPGYL